MFSSFMTSFIHRRKFTVVIQKKALFWGRIGCCGHFMEFLRICKEINFLIQKNYKQRTVEIENIGGIFFSCLYIFFAKINDIRR